MKFLSVILFLFFLSGCVPPSGEGGSSPLIAILPFVLIFVFFYLLILRPQQKQNRQREEMLSNLKRGDDVITSGGIYGKIVNLDDDILTVEIAKGINVKMSKAGVTGKIDQKAEQQKKNQKPKGGR